MEKNAQLTAYDEAINYLKISPMFNLSLSSKELFHSNFLYWIYTKDKDVFKQLIRDICEIETSSWLDNNWQVKREKENFDLCICQYTPQSNQKGPKTKLNEDILLVIENKFKSLPTDKQLQDYDAKLQKHQNCKKILLSLTSPDEQKESSWEWVGYDKIVEALYRIQNDRANKSFDDYERSLIGDYATFVQSMITLTTLWIKKDEEPSSHFLLDYKVKEQGDSQEENNDKIAETNGDQYYKDAKELRIHDLYGKYRTIKLVERLRNKLKEQLKKINLPQGITLEPQMAYTRSQPILEVKISGIGESKDDKHAEAESFLISIQGSQYRHAINAFCDDPTNSKEKRKEESKNHIANNDKWHWFMDPGHHPREDNYRCFFPKGEIWADKGGQRIGNNYCGYAGEGGLSYIYQYKKIKDGATIENILDAMVNDVVNVIEQLDKPQ